MYGTDELTIIKVYLMMDYSWFASGERSWDGYYLPAGSITVESWPDNRTLHAELTPSDVSHRGTMVELRVWETDDGEDYPQWMISPEIHHRTRDIVARLKKLGFSLDK